MKPGTYQQKKTREAARNAAASREERDIGPCPRCKNPERRERCRGSLLEFCRTYFPAKFFLPFSADQVKVIARLEQCVRSHGLFALAMPRGSGKTEMSKRAAEWGVLYGFRRFVVIVGADEDSAGRIMRDVKASFETNDRLAEDFPEACYPVRRLEGIHNRAGGQTLDGRRTRIQWTQGEIRLPDVEGSPSAGAVIRTEGITGSVRGLSTTAADGGTMRPDLAILDDPQTKKSAVSTPMTQQREEIVRGDVLGLAGPDRSLSVIMPCTVIEAGDLADRFLDRRLNPQWSGERLKRVYAFPGNAELWDEYANVRAAGLRAGDNGAAGNAFYTGRRAELDAGCVVDWPERYDRAKFLSAVQEAMTQRIENPAAFAAEMQNEPIAANAAAAAALDPAAVASKVSNLGRMVVPRDVTRLTAMIDVGEHLLWYAVVGWDERFGGSVLDYGPYPDQPRTEFHSSQARVALDTLPEVRGQSGERAIYAALSAVAARILGRTYQQHETGQGMRVERCLVDANYGPRTDLVYQFCRESREYSGVLTPSHGKFIGASTNAMSSWAVKPGERTGPGWRLSPTSGGRGRHVTFDTNQWKTFLAARLRTPPGAAGCLVLFDSPDAGHHMLGQHCAAEYPVPVAGRGRTVEEWKDIPGRDNHLWDCLVGCCVAASVQGLTWSAGGETEAAPKRRKVSIEELHAAARAREQQRTKV